MMGIGIKGKRKKNRNCRVRGRERVERNGRSERERKRNGKILTIGRMRGGKRRNGGGRVRVGERKRD